MHEMALAESMLEIVEQTARGNGARRVTLVRLEIGALSHVEPEALRFCFDVVTRESLAEGARLDIETTPGEAWCMPCGDGGPAVRIGRGVSALRQLSAQDFEGRCNACAGNRGCVTVLRAGATPASDSRRSVMCTTCGCGNAQTRIEGKSMPESVGSSRRRGRFARDRCRRKISACASPGLVFGHGDAHGRGVREGEHWHQHEDGTWHSHTRRRRTCRMVGRKWHRRVDDAGCHRFSIAHGPGRAGPACQERFDRSREPACICRPRRVCAESGLEPGIGEDDAAGEDDRCVARPNPRRGHRGRPADIARRRSRARGRRSRGADQHRKGLPSRRADGRECAFAARRSPTTACC